MRYLMNPHTGSVDTEENWRAESVDWLQVEEGQPSAEVQLTTLVEVELDDNGDWVEKE